MESEYQIGDKFLYLEKEMSVTGLSDSKIIKVVV